MNAAITNHRREPHSATGHLHSLVYGKAIVGFTLWFIAAAWGFDGDGYAGYLLSVVTGFIAMVLGLIWVSQRAGEDDAPHRRESMFADWASGDFETWTGSVKGSQAAVEILLPIAAIAIGMTIFAVVAAMATR